MESALSDNFRHLASYNQRMNQSLYRALASLAERELTLDRSVFFGSILGTLNHLIFGDHFILTRVRSLYNEPSALDSLEPQWEFEPTKTYAEHLEALRQLRESIDQVIIDFVSALDPRALGKRGKIGERELPLWPLLEHLFQHQTHHRGQVTALMSQAGLPYGRTGFIDSYLQDVGEDTT